MNKICNLKIHCIFFVLFLTGCAQVSSIIPSSKDLLLMSNTMTSKSNNKIVNQLAPSKDKDLESQKFTSRKLTLTFSQEEKLISQYNKKLIMLFFQTIPKNKKLKAIVSVAPSTSGVGFSAAHISWSRTQAVKTVLKQYVEHIENVYDPKQASDTLNLKVIGN